MAKLRNHSHGKTAYPVLERAGFAAVLHTAICHQTPSEAADQPSCHTPTSLYLRTARAPHPRHPPGLPTVHKEQQRKELRPVLLPSQERRTRQAVAARWQSRPTGRAAQRSCGTSQILPPLVPLGRCSCNNAASAAAGENIPTSCLQEKIPLPNILTLVIAPIFTA